MGESGREWEREGGERVREGKREREREREKEEDILSLFKKPRKIVLLQLMI